METVGTDTLAAGPNEPAVTPPPLSPPVPPRPRFTIVGNCIGLVLFVLIISFSYRDLITEPSLATLWYPEDTSLRIADRFLAFQTIRETLAEPLRTQNRLFVAGKDFDYYAREILEECEEFVLGKSEPLNDLRVLSALAVLDFEEGKRESAESRLTLIAGAPGSVGMAANLRAAYASQPRVIDDDEAYATASRLPEEWYYPTLQARFAEGRGDAALALRWRQSVGASLRERRAGLYFLNALGNLLFLGGLVAILHNWRHPAKRSNLPVWWSVTEGLGVFFWGAALGHVAYFLISTTPLPLLQETALFYSVITGLPAVLLVLWRLCRPFGIEICALLGLHLSATIVRSGLILLAIQSVFAFGLTLLFDWLEPRSSMTEGVDEMMIWGSVGQKIATLLNATLGAGVFEEILFRGVLFLTLRKCGGFFAAATISSLIFAGVHFYSWPGFVSVGVFGFLQAWSVERTQSLMPAILVHIATNFFIFGWQMIMFA